ncbi:hypothetical protein [Tritonibacter horizontis]|uniref:Uncharacterized protein n=1 Tax=Tritonibacter horizontis TaxID=1768241 RepID=A0A132BYR1_9RHOB|nr:hypothetical protein [Tritonibacter horizontis]KUP92870.1 hypothetical protein TRIHO_23210 [Tritonibacter horizontis]
MVAFVEIQDEMVNESYSSFRPLCILLEKFQHQLPHKELPFPLQLAFIIEAIVKEHPHLMYNGGKIPSWMFGELILFIVGQESKNEGFLGSHYKKLRGAIEISAFSSKWKEYEALAQHSQWSSMVLKKNELVWRILLLKK